MKAISIPFFIFASLLFLMSCSAEKKAVNLKVSTSFALGANGFTGGLVVTGKSQDGKTFTATTIGGKELQVALVNGSWSISVVGWNGSTLFAGSTLCGHSNVVLDSNTTTINLTANEALCENSEFTGGKTNLAEVAFGFRQLIIGTCSNLTYKSGTNYVAITPESTPSAFSTSFCTGDLPQEFKKRAHSVKIIIPGEKSELASSCIELTSLQTQTGIRFPTGKIPVRVQLYDDSTCTDTPEEFNFKNGLIAGSTDFDSVVNNQFGAPSFGLFLPYNDMKRGFSATMNLLPSMKCNYAQCLPEAITPADYYFHPGLTFQKIKIDSKCNALSYTIGNADELETPATGECIEEDGDSFLSLRIKGNSYCLSTPCAITINSSPKLISQDQQNLGEARNAYDSTWRLLGTNSNNTFYDITLHNDNREGKLGRAIESMGPGGPISLLGNITCSQISTTPKKEITLFDEGSYKTYQVEGAPSTKIIPSLLCDNGDAIPTSCSATTFSTKVTVRQLENQIWKAREVIHLHCNYKIGMIEDQATKLDNSLIRTEKQVMGWNTETVGFERMESFEYEEKKNAAGSIVEASTNFSRGQIIANNFQAQIFEWRTSKNASSDYFDHLAQKDLYRSGT